MNNFIDALFYTWTYFNSTTSIKLTNSQEYQINGRTLVIPSLTKINHGYYRVNVFFESGRRDQSFIFQLIVLSRTGPKQCPETMRYYGSDCAPCQETCSNEKCLFECRSGVCACPAETPVYYQGKCIARHECPRDLENPCQKFEIEGYRYYGSNECAPCMETCDKAVTSCQCRRNTCGCPPEQPIVYKGRCIARSDCPTGQCGDSTNMVYYDNQCAPCVRKCSEISKPCSKACRSNVCGCPSSKPYVNENGWCVDYDYCMNINPRLCHNNQVYYKLCAPMTKTCNYQPGYANEGAVIVGCKSKVCACPQYKPYLLEGICVEEGMCPVKEAKVINIIILYHLIGTDLTLRSPSENDRVRWYHKGARLRSNSKYLILDNKLTIRALGGNDEGTYYGNTTSNINSFPETSSVFRVFPLARNSLYVWYENSPLTVSSGIRSALRPVFWMREKNDTFIDLSSSLMHRQDSLGDLTFVNLQLSDSGWYHAIYLDPDTNRITRKVVNITVIPQPQLQSRSCFANGPCVVNVDLYAGYHQVEWYTIVDGSKSYISTNGNKYETSSGSLVINDFKQGDVNTFYGQVTYLSNKNYVLTYPWKTELSSTGTGGSSCGEGGVRTNCEFVICNPMSTCEVAEGGSVELTINYILERGDSAMWYIMVNGEQRELIAIDGKYYVKQGGSFVEIVNLGRSDSGNYYVYVNFANGTRTEYNYNLTVTEKSTSYQEIGFDRCWEYKGGNECMKEGGECAWCTDEDWALERCMTYYNAQLKPCKNFIYIETTIIIDEGKALGGEDKIQVTPQKVTTEIRPGQCAEFDLKMKSISEYPLDVFMLQQQVGGSSRDLFNGAVRGIVTTVKDISSETQVGYGTFTYRNSYPQGTNSTYSSGGSFKAVNYLDSTADIESIVQEEMSEESLGQGSSGSGGGNAAFDALYQSLVCDNIGWRTASNKVFFVQIDDNPKVAGDGKLDGFTERFDGKCRTGNTRTYEPTTDYPSLTQMANKLVKSNTIPVFIVSDKVDKQMLTENFPNAKVFDMKEVSR